MSKGWEEKVSLQQYKDINVLMAETDVRPLIGLLFLLKDLKVSRGFPSQMQIAEFAWNYGKVRHMERGRDL